MSSTWLLSSKALQIPNPSHGRNSGHAHAIDANIIRLLFKDYFKVFPLVKPKKLIQNPLQHNLISIERAILKIKIPTFSAQILSEIVGFSFKIIP